MDEMDRLNPVHVWAAKAPTWCDIEELFDTAYRDDHQPMNDFASCQGEERYDIHDLFAEHVAGRSIRSALGGNSARMDRIEHAWRERVSDEFIGVIVAAASEFRQPRDAVFGRVAIVFLGAFELDDGRRHEP